MLGASDGNGVAERPEPDLRFPSMLPAFGGGGIGGRYAERSPQGHIWIRRFQGYADSASRYDLIDAASNAFLGSVELPRNARVITFGATSVYVVVTDVDGVQVVHRHRYPDVPIPAHR